jgi:hypothetical protein
MTGIFDFIINNYYWDTSKILRCVKMKKLLPLIVFITLLNSAFAQLPAGAQWGCPTIPVSGEFDTTCFKPAGEILLGQGYFDHYTSSDPVYLVIPQNRPSYSIAMAVAWNYYRNVLGRDGMSINQWFATMGQENGFATYNGAPQLQLPATIFDLSVGANVAIPCLYPRGCNSNTCAGAGHCWHVGQNGTDGPYHNSLAGYQTTSPYVPQRYPGPAATYHTLFNSTMEMASMNKTYYDLSIYRRAQYMNNVDLTPIEQSSPDPYGVEAAQAVAYNLGPNAAGAISAPGYTAPAGLASNNNWAVNYFSGGVSCYAQRIAAMTAVLDNNQAYAVSHYPAGCGGNVANWNFYSFYDAQIKWDTVLASVNRLLPMYPEINNFPAVKASFISAVQTAFNQKDVDANGFISFRYEMGSVIDAIVMNLPKDDPAFNGQFAVNGTGCKLDCQAPYTVIRTSGPKTICVGQSVVLTADVESPTSSVTYQWQKNGANIAGATSQTYTVTPASAGTDVYSVFVCWTAPKLSNGASTTCCAQPECSVTIVAQGSCSTCSMGMILTPTANSCTGMTNGSILATVSIAAGPYTYTIIGPAPATTTTSVNSASVTHTFTNLRDGKYTVEVRQQSTPTCRAIQDIFIVPTTVIKESLTATQVPASCNTQLNAVLVNQQPNTCNLKVDYGALGIYNWDPSFFIDVKINGFSSTTLFEGLNTSPGRFPWNWPACSPWPTACMGQVPATKTMTVTDGDTVSVFGSSIVPQGTAVQTYVDGGVVLSGSGITATFTRVGVGTTTNTVSFAYQPPAPINGTRQMGNSYVISCPVVGAPVYTYAWTPTTGLSNAAIKNPTSSVNVNTTYTVTATHPTNASCKLTANITVLANCAAAPIELISFNAVAENSVVKLNWITTNEIDCDEYYIERSRDGITFEVIGNVNCNNSTSINEYNFTDENPYFGSSYYRLREMDFDFNRQYSEIREVSINNCLVSIQPNPFGNDTKVTIEGTDNNPVEVKVIELSGKEMLSTTLHNEKTLTLGSGYAAGVYILQVTYNRVARNYKLVKQ